LETSKDDKVDFSWVEIQVQADFAKIKCVSDWALSHASGLHGDLEALKK